MSEVFLGRLKIYHWKLAEHYPVTKNSTSLPLPLLASESNVVTVTVTHLRKVTPLLYRYFFHYFYMLKKVF